MPVFRLSRDLIFPPPALSEPDGLLAVGGDLSVKRLLLAYSMGIFPWYSDDAPILWWSPDPRLVLFPAELHVPRSLRQTIRKEQFRVTFDTAFERVIRACAERHEDTKGDTWITDEMIDAYLRLHRAGYAHSVESWSADGSLAGGLYGVSLGSVFFGESMFARVSDASKVAFVTLVERVRQEGCSMIDCQMTTHHLQRFGAREIPREVFLHILDEGLKNPTRSGSWNTQDK